MPATQIDTATLAEAIETLERVGCQYNFCGGPTMQPVDMVTCFACETLAKLRVAAGRPPRTDDEQTWQERHDEWERNYMARATGNR